LFEKKRFDSSLLLKIELLEICLVHIHGQIGYIAN